MGQLEAIMVALGAPWEDVVARLRTITQPVLYANGSHDVMIDAYASYAAVQELPNAKLVLYSDAGHAFLFQHLDRLGQLPQHALLGGPHDPELHLLERRLERIEVLIGLGAGIKSGRTDGEGSFMRLVMQRASRQAALYPGLRNEGDQMLPQIGAEMRAALIAQAHDRDTAFARRAAACQYSRRRAVFLGRKHFANICNHGRQAPDEWGN
jgi:hypothetical protein